jgi:integrase
MEITLTEYFAEFEADWVLEGKAERTATKYVDYLDRFASWLGDEPASLAAAKKWIATSPTQAGKQERAKALRAFGKWADTHEGPDWQWWSRIPFTKVAQTPQPTAIESDYAETLRKLRLPRHRLALELLWSTGARVSEVAAMRVEDCNLDERFVVIRKSKTDKPRLAPLSDRACRQIRRLPHAAGPVLEMSAGAIQLMLKKIDAPSPHAWRRGWAVRSLRSGVSEVSVRRAAGWTTGRMVERHTAALADELAMHEFRRLQTHL